MNKKELKRAGKNQLNYLKAAARVKLHGTILTCAHLKCQKKEKG